MMWSFLKLLFFSLRQQGPHIKAPGEKISVMNSYSCNMYYMEVNLPDDNNYNEQ